uniref:AlNc14C217G9026 protein n=1 Tax=Albugo laibachii Nc14 TaxID=890382 RepID=F0WRM8_9STRA|nr:AlNc14C217G9026 [Albugo laibachii Nc14]|eukprot:CCA23992.1 AlNc14C217G9026 [Albugo laibachii Nc14]
MEYCEMALYIFSVNRRYLTTIFSVKWVHTVMGFTTLPARDPIVGERAPRPLGAALRATKPNEVLYSMPKASDGFKYILVSKDGMSGFCELIPWKQANAEAVVH